MLGPVPCGACGKFVSYRKCCLVMGIKQGLREAPQKPGKLCCPLQRLLCPRSYLGACLALC